MKVFVATPAYNGLVTTSYVSSVFSLHSVGVDVDWVSIDDSLVCRARNTLVANFLRSGIEHMLCVDGDIGFDPQQIVDMFEFDQDFVAGAAPLKDYFDDGLRYAVTRCNNQERDASGRFITVERVGGSLMLIKRTAFEKMIKAYPSARYDYDLVSRQEGNFPSYALFDPLLVEGLYLSEDTGSATVGERWAVRFGSILKGS
jgi:hypothetical protein